MSLILNIETATEVCSVCLSKDGEIISIRESFSGRVHATSLTLFIQECLNDAGAKFNDLDAVAVSEGPGSYTGLRIGVAVAKGICYATGLPLVPVNTLQAMAALYVSQNEVSLELIIPMIDARRMEVYTAVYSSDLKEVKPVDAVILNDVTFSEFEKDEKPMVFIGDANAKVKELYQNKPDELYMFDDQAYTSSKGMALLSHNLLNVNQIANTAYFEPRYLKDFVGVKASGTTSQ